MKRKLLVGAALLLGLGILTPSFVNNGKVNKVKGEDTTIGQSFDSTYLETFASPTTEVSNSCPYYSINFGSMDNETLGYFTADCEEHNVALYLTDDLAIKGPIEFCLTDDYYILNIYLNSHVVYFDKQNEEDKGSFFCLSSVSIDTADTIDNIVVNVYGGEKSRTNYFRKNNFTGHYVYDEYGNLPYQGGCITAFDYYALYANLGGTYNFYDLNIVGNEAGLITSGDVDLNFYNTLIEANYTKQDKRAILDLFSNAEAKVDACFENCLIQNNHTLNYSTVHLCGSGSSSEGVEYEDCGNIYLNNTKIINNVAERAQFTEGISVNDIGVGLTVDYATGGCFAEGTKVNLANGQTKNIEDIELGDEVLTFNHDTGDVEGNIVIDFYQSGQTKDSFTLNFSNDISLDVVETHGFLDQDENGYVIIDKTNAREYVGDHFYNAIDDRWETLESVTYNYNSVNFYSFYTGYNYNAIIEKMVTMEDDVVYTKNSFEFVDGKILDQVKIQQYFDIYGEYTYEECEFDITEELFDMLQLRYLKIFIGRGIITEERVAKILSTLVPSDSVDPKALKRNKSASENIGNEQHGIILGSNVVIKDNTAQGEQHNVLLMHYFGGDEIEYCRPLFYFDEDSTNCQIGVISYNENQVVATNVSEGDQFVNYFLSDRGNRVFYSEENNQTYYEHGTKYPFTLNNNEQFRLYTGEPIEYSLSYSNIDYDYINLKPSDFTLTYVNEFTDEEVDVPTEKGRYIVNVDFAGCNNVLEFHETRYMTIGNQIQFNETGADERCSLASTFSFGEYYTNDIIELPYPELSDDLHLNVVEGYEFVGWYDYADKIIHKYGEANQNVTNDYKGVKHLAPVFVPNNHKTPTKDNGYDVAGSIDDCEVYSYQWQKYTKHVYNLIEADSYGMINAQVSFDAQERLESVESFGITGLFFTNLGTNDLYVEFKLLDPTVHLKTAIVDSLTEDVTEFVDVPYNEYGVYSIKLTNANDDEFVVIKASDNSSITFAETRFAQCSFTDIPGETSSQLQNANEKTQYRCKISNKYGIEVYSEALTPKTISFVCSDGVMANTEAYQLEGRQIDLSKYVPTKGRYEFLGWATTEGGEVTYEPDDVITVTDDLTLYAVYFAKNNQYSGTAITGTGTTEDPVTGSVSGAIEGDTYLNTETFNMYRYDGTEWSFVGNIKGADGADGTNGTDGKDGKDGTNGVDGKDGKDGKSVVSIAKTSSEGLVDTYTITYSDNSTSTFTVTNGSDGADGNNPTVTISNDGYWEINGSKTTAKAVGQDGTNGTDGKDAVAPKMRINDQTQEWEISTDDGTTWTTTGVVAMGLPGSNGIDGKDGEDGTNLLPALIISMAVSALSLSGLIYFLVREIKQKGI